MKIILSPAKKMIESQDFFVPETTAVFMKQTQEILACLKTKNGQQLKQIWNCNERLLASNRSRLECMDFSKQLVPAIFAYDGIAYQYLAAEVLQQDQLTYLQQHLRILSAFYGVLKPFDGIRAYRLEMQADLQVNGKADLYQYWGDLWYREVLDEDGLIINLASNEYAKAIRKYLDEDVKMIDVLFCHRTKQKLKTKATYAKMGRGQMVRYMAENQITNIEQLKQFQNHYYHFDPELSSDQQLVFVCQEE